MNKSRRYLLFAVLLILPTLLPSEAEAAHPRLRGVAEHSVLAARHATGLTTAFAYGRDGAVIAAAGNGAIDMITSTGVAVSGEIGTSRDGLGVAHVAALPLRPLLATAATSVGRHTPKYILGPPLGYESDRIHSVQMPTVRLTRARLQRIVGTLPAKLLGAPVVTAHGRLIGSVAGVGARSWEFAPLALLTEIGAVHDGTGVPVVPILIAGLVVFLAGTAFGISRMKRRRDQELDLHLRQSRAREAAQRRADGPLVRLRTPPQEPAHNGDEDFEVVVKPRRERT